MDHNTDLLKSLLEERIVDYCESKGYGLSSLSNVGRPTLYRINLGPDTRSNHCNSINVVNIIFSMSMSNTLSIQGFCPDLFIPIEEVTSESLIYMSLLCNIINENIFGCRVFSGFGATNNNINNMNEIIPAIITKSIFSCSKDKIPSIEDIDDSINGIMFVYEYFGDIMSDLLFNELKYDINQYTKNITYLYKKHFSGELEMVNDSSEKTKKPFVMASDFASFNKANVYGTKDMSNPIEKKYQDFLKGYKK